MEIRLANVNEVDDILKIVKQGQEYMRREGIPQWTNGYPGHSDILKDIENNGAYVLVDGNRIVGYSYITTRKDSNYDVIIGKWLNDEGYAVMHRTCIDNAYKGQRLTDLFIQKAFEMSDNVRVDTHEKNKSMRKMLENHGFVNCGIVYMQDKTERVAYQKKKDC